MRKAFSSVASVLCALAVAAAAAGCGDDSTDTASADQHDADLGYAAYQEAGKLFDCSTAYDDLDKAQINNDVAGEHEAAKQYRELIVDWDKKISEIRFPPDSRDEQERLHQNNLAEIDALADIAAAVRPADAREMVWRAFVLEDKSYLAADDLVASLGHPRPQARLAADRLILAHAEADLAALPVQGLFDAALDAHDLTAATAANQIEIRADQQYLDSIGTIDFPAKVTAQVQALKQAIQTGIDFDRQQVAVPTTADVVRAPAGGTPAVQQADQLRAEIIATLGGMETAPSKPDCPKATG
ncbi:hypothetical protein FOS14_13100 [Skermania sp. ID1734]|uniref:hypothetical protein n=1 Tax=Skermania sp. ID1734 TaxID=2597516 RepID=UPI00117C94FB|nr:hypothetical protein [Skermania sp. ID1734]TSD99283.1 hypothetical protein FOS14_13100 [Skermania sp. ID1734]